MNDENMIRRVAEAMRVPLLTPREIQSAVTDAVVQAACDEAGWTWKAEPNVPSPQSCMRPIVQAAFDKLADGSKVEAGGAP